MKSKKKVDKAQMQPVVRPGHDPNTEAVFCAALCLVLDPNLIEKVTSRYIELRDDWKHTLALLGR